VALIIVPLDVGKIDGRGDAGVLVKLAGVIPEVGIVDEPPQIAFEVPGIDRVIRMISDDSFDTMTLRALSQSTGTVTRPV
jgi:hypothetical protein